MVPDSPPVLVEDKLRYEIFILVAVMWFMLRSWMCRFGFYRCSRCHVGATSCFRSRMASNSYESTLLASKILLLSVCFVKFFRRLHSE